MSVRAACVVLGAIILASVRASAEPTRILFDVKHQNPTDGSYWALDEDGCRSVQITPTPDQKLIHAATEETFWDGALSALGVDLARSNVQVETLTSRGLLTYGDPNNPQDLSKYAVYVIIEPDDPFDATEIDAISRFVQGGGGLFLIADRAKNVSWDSPRILNDISRKFGIVFSNASKDRQLGWFNDSGGSTAPSSELTQPTGPRFVLSDSTSMALSGGARGHAWRKGLGPQTGTGFTLATAEFGQGRVAALGDSAVLGDETNCGGRAVGHYLEADSANRAIVRNTFAWLSRIEKNLNVAVKFRAPRANGKVTGAQVPVRLVVNGEQTRAIKVYLDDSVELVDLKKPYEFQWDTTRVADGRHQLSAKALDSRGEVVALGAISVEVQNPKPGPPSGWLVLALWVAVTLLAIAVIMHGVKLGRRVALVGRPDALPGSVLPAKKASPTNERPFGYDPVTDVVATDVGVKPPTEPKTSGEKSAQESAVSPLREFEIERVVLDVVNRFVGQQPPVRRDLRDALLRHGVQATMISPYKVPESANIVFTRYWFEPDERAGSWLRVPLEGGAQFVVVPFDMRVINREIMMTHLSGLYEGAGHAGGLASPSHVKFALAAIVASAENDSYRVVRRGALTSVGASRPSAVSDTARELVARELASDDVRVKRIEARLEQIEHKMQAFEERHQRQGRIEPAPMSGETDIPLRLEERLRRIDQRIDYLSQQADDLGIVSSRVSTLEALMAQLEHSVRDVRLTESLGRARAAEISPKHDTRAFVSDRVIAPEPVADAFRAAPEPASMLGNGPEIPALPQRWVESLSRSRGNSTFDEAATYASALLEAYNEIRTSAPNETVIVHLLPLSHGIDTLYEIHVEDVGNGAGALRCKANPTAYTPAQQFFVAYRSGKNRLAVVCIPGVYRAVSFDLTPLVGEIPGPSFRIQRVTRPALLQERDDGRYRVIAKMQVALA